MVYCVQAAHDYELFWRLRRNMVLALPDGYDVWKARSLDRLWLENRGYRLRNYLRTDLTVDNEHWSLCQLDKAVTIMVLKGIHLLITETTLYPTFKLHRVASGISGMLWWRIYGVLWGFSWMLEENAQTGKRKNFLWERKDASPYISAIANLSRKRPGHPFLCLCIGLSLRKAIRHVFVCFRANGNLAAIPHEGSFEAAPLVLRVWIVVESREGGGGWGIMKEKNQEKEQWNLPAAASVYQ